MRFIRIALFASLLLGLYACAGNQPAMDPSAAAPSAAPAQSTTPPPAASTHQGKTALLSR